MEVTVNEPVYVDYPTRSAMIESLLSLRARGVDPIDVVDNGRTLRFSDPTFEEGSESVSAASEPATPATGTGQPPAASDGASEAAPDSGDAVVPATPAGGDEDTVEEPAEDDEEDLIGVGGPDVVEEPVQPEHFDVVKSSTVDEIEELIEAGVLSLDQVIAAETAPGGKNRKGVLALKDEES